MLKSFATAVTLIGLVGTAGCESSPPPPEPRPAAQDSNQLDGTIPPAEEQPVPREAPAHEAPPADTSNQFGAATESEIQFPSSRMQTETASESRFDTPSSGGESIFSNGPPEAAAALPRSAEGSFPSTGELELDLSDSPSSDGSVPRSEGF